MGIVSRIVGIAVLLAVIGGASWYFLRDLQQVSLERFEITGIADVSADSFTVNGALHVKNPSKVPVPIQSITYDVVLKRTGEILSSGSIPVVLLEAGQTTRIPFQQSVEWVPTAALAVELLTQERVYATVKGRLRINIPELQNYEIPFEKDVDLKAYIAQFAGASPLPGDPIQDIAERTAEGSDALLPDEPLSALLP